MSSSIAIPARKQAARSSLSGGADGSSSSSYQSSFSLATPGSSYYASTPLLNGSPSSPGNLSKAPITTSTPVGSKIAGASERIQPRRPSLLGSSLSKSEYTVVNLGAEGGPPRLVTCVKSSQGFNWNQELFLPSYADYDYQDLECQPDPVQDIILTDEEAAAIFPQ